MIDVYLLLGSNLGNRELFLQQAINAIEQAIAPVKKRSKIHQTPAWGKTDEPDYLNQALMLQTGMPAQKVLDTILAIEKSLGRKRKEKWGSRTIDIDILFYGDKIINQPHLTVPHPQLHKRKFALEPLAELGPDLLHPGLKQTVSQLIKLLDNQP
jgi:2-amino-4-hydroxy-6-hydroxymethyldihydropteridine diphosphokinase